MGERRARCLRGEDGMTLVEVLIAALLMAVGVIAMISVFDSSRGLVTTSEKNDVVAHEGEAEMERLLARDYRSIALTTTPSHSSSSTDPDYYVQPDGTYQWDQSTSPRPADPVVVDGTHGAVAHISTWNDGQSRLSGSIYRYVTWIDDPNIAGTQDTKRVTVVVTVNNTDTGAAAGQLKKPVLLSSVVIDPAAQ